MTLSTSVWKVNPADPDLNVIREAAAALRDGGLVAFPTETVYGLGSNALSEWAVRKVFAAKGRPATNPLIVHVADVAQVGEVAASWPDLAAKLAAAFWPGPLTLVVPRKPELPDVVTAGGPTVAVRCPKHPVAASLIREAGVPVAAPSANRSTELSPTRAEHVLKGLDGRIDAVLDGGPCPGGIESTVVDATGAMVRVLRPGLVTVPMLEAVVGRVEASRGREPPDSAPRSPGQMARHYSPRTPVVLADDPDDADHRHQELSRAGSRVIILGYDQIWNYHFISDDPAEYAADLYSALHDLDDGRYDRIVVVMPPNTPEWAAIRDRLTRAAGSAEAR